jgi:hypothetical protein
MLVFPEATKFFDGTTTAFLTSLKGSPAGVTLIAGPGSSATFDTAAVGANRTVSFTGYTLGGPNAALYAFASNCCGAITQKTTATIRPAAITRGVLTDIEEYSDYFELATPALASFAVNRQGLMPTYTSDAGDVYLAIKEETPAVVAPVVRPPRPPAPRAAPYVAPQYAPKPARN